jgi:hypothetical protein
MKRTFRQAFFVIIALGLLASVSPAQTQAEKPVLGSWKGHISIMSQTLEIRFVFSLDEAKKIAGTFDSISQGASGIKLTDIKVEGKTIAFNLDPALVPGNATFKGALDAAGTKIAGDFSQAGYTGTFSVEKETPKK